MRIFHSLMPSLDEVDNTTKLHQHFDYDKRFTKRIDGVLTPIHQTTPLFVPQRSGSDAS